MDKVILVEVNVRSKLGRYKVKGAQEKNNEYMIDKSKVKV